MDSHISPLKMGIPRSLICLSNTKADVNSFDRTFETPQTPIQQAASNGHLKTVDLLITAGAKICFERTVCDHDPLHRATYQNHVDVGKLLLESGADVNAKDRRDENPREIASRMDSQRICQND